MINLLPTAEKESILYARRNGLLIRWIVVFLIAGLIFAGIIAFGQFYINSNIANAQSQATVTNERIAAQKLEQSQKELKSISDNLKTVVQIASTQLLFSKLLNEIGKTLPAGTALNGITISANDSALDLNISAVSQEKALQAQVNLNTTRPGEKTKLFGSADIITLSCATTAIDSYPCDMQVRVAVKPDSSFYFINSEKNK